MSVMSSGPTSHTFFSQRLRLHYVDWGNPTAPPLLMVHGGRDHCRNWDWLAERLRSRWHIIAPDLRGHGDSQWSTEGSYRMDNYVYDLAQLIHQQQLAPDWSVVLSHPGAHLHLYGKREARPGRKMGHVTLCAATLDEALTAATAMKAALASQK